MKKIMIAVIILIASLDVMGQTDPNDPMYDRQWYLEAINMPAAWDLITGDGTVTLAVMDCGIQGNHPDLVNAICIGKDFTTGSAYSGEPSPSCTHGTQVAGVAAAETNNSEGIAGTAWDVQLMPLKVFATSDMGAAYEYAEEYADVVTNSIDFCKDNTNDLAALEDARNKGRNGKGCVCTKSSGNRSDGIMDEDRNVPEFILVGAVNQELVRATCYNSSWWWTPDDSDDGKESAYDDSLDVVAPGSSIYSTIIGSNYGWLSQGTSYAAPQVAGLAALIIQANPDLTASQVQAIIQFTAEDLEYVTRSLTSEKVLCAAGSSTAFSVLNEVESYDSDNMILEEILIKLNVTDLDTDNRSDKSELGIKLEVPSLELIDLIETGDLDPGDIPEDLLLRDDPNVYSVTYGVSSAHKIRRPKESFGDVSTYEWSGYWNIQVYNNLDAIEDVYVQCCITCIYNNIDALESELDEAGFEVATAGRDKYTGYGLIDAEAAIELAQSPRFIIRGSNGIHIASFDAEGNMVLEGDLTTSATSTSLAQTSAAEFIVKSGSTNVARIDESGNMWVAGTLMESAGSLTPPSDSFIVEVPGDSGNTPVAYIDLSGNLVLLGRVFKAATSDS